MAWIGKCVVLPSREFFKLGTRHSDPLKLTAELFALMAVLFALPPTILKSLGY
jgi:hypothetical protein